MSFEPLLRDGAFAGPVPAPLRRVVHALATDGAGASPLHLDEDTVTLAMGEGLGPLLGSRVVSGELVVPAHRRDELVWQHQVCIASNLLRKETVERLARLYRSRGIPLLLLKGMAVIQSVLRPGERSMSDVDVLVPASRWNEACDLAVQGGFQRDMFPGRPYTIEHDYVRSFTAPGGVIMEIHRYVCERSLFDLEYEGPVGIFARARALPSGAFIPDPSDLFLTLVAHAAKHTFELPLRSFVDGVFLLRRDWPPLSVVRRRARDWQMEAALAAWLSALANVEGAAADQSPSGDLEHEVAATRAGLAWRCGQLVWSRTGHASPWQRFVRLAWLTDSVPQWINHVGTRLALRVLDLLLSRRSTTGRSPGVPLPVPGESGRGR